jgi:hypothetical protein
MESESEGTTSELVSNSTCDSVNSRSVRRSSRRKVTEPVLKHKNSRPTKTPEPSKIDEKSKGITKSKTMPKERKREASNTDRSQMLAWAGKLRSQKRYFA